MDNTEIAFVLVYLIAVTFVLLAVKWHIKLTEAEVDIDRLERKTIELLEYQDSMIDDWTADLHDYENIVRLKDEEIKWLETKLSECKKYILRQD